MRLAQSAKCPEFIQVAVHIKNPFLFIGGQWYSIAWMYHSLFIHSLFEGHLGHFQSWAITNRAAMEIHAQVFVCT